MDRVDRLRQLATSVAGRSLGDSAIAAILGTEDWRDYWPVVDEGGVLTGDIADGGEGVLVDWWPSEGRIKHWPGACEALCRNLARA